MSQRAAHVRRCREIAATISELSQELAREAIRARDAGASWNDLALAIRGEWRSGIPDALGNLLPVGTSTTTVRGWVESRRP